jgi:hypothetical protein
MSDELKNLSPTQIALPIAFACGITAVVIVLVFYGLLWLIGPR